MNLATLTRAEALFAQGQRSEAFGLLDDAVARDPTDAELRVRYAKLAQRVAAEHDGPNALHELAESLLLKALAIAPDRRDARNQLQLLGSICVPHAGTSDTLKPVLREADAHFAADRIADAARGYEAVAQQDPRHFTALKYRGNCAFVAERWAEAEQWFRQAIAVNPLDPQAHQFLSDTILRANPARGAEALDANFAAIAANPRYWAAWIKLDDRMPRSAPLHRFRADRTVFPAKWTDLSQPPPVTRDANAPPHVNDAWEIYVRAYFGAASNPSAFERMRTGYLAVADHVRRVMQQYPALRFPPDLGMWPLFQDHGDLDAAIFVLLFDADFRAAFEAWKGNAGGAKVGDFVMRARVRPF